MSDPKRIAIIDLGSNTARLVVMNALPGYAFRLEDEIREVVRLRQGMTEDGLAEAAMDRAFVTLRLFKRFCDSVRADEIIATATSAVRDAANGRFFLNRVQREARPLPAHPGRGARGRTMARSARSTTWRSPTAPWSISAAAAPRSAR